MKVLVTGATGYIGLKLSQALAEKGFTVHALCRDKIKSKGLEHPNIHVFFGDILNVESLKNAMNSCDIVFHLAAYAKTWARKPETYHLVNVTGTENVLKLAKQMHVKKLIVTSTAGVYGPSEGTLVNEHTKREIPYFNEYESTKASMEEMVENYVTSGLDVTIVSPTRVFGPGIISDSNGVTKLIMLYMKHKYGIMPGNGKSKGNYVYIDDVINGYLLALEKGMSGERYILGGENVSYVDFFKTLAEVSAKKYRIFGLPLIVMLAVSSIMLFLAKTFGIYPLITPSWVKRYHFNWELTSAKAEKELGYTSRPFFEGLKSTLEYLKKEKMIQNG